METIHSKAKRKKELRSLRTIEQSCSVIPGLLYPRVLHEREMEIHVYLV